MSRTITATSWQIEIPDVPFNGKTIAIPSVHPMGDRRLVRCAQSALNAGFGVHFVWMGGEPGRHVYDERVSEFCLPQAQSFKDRLMAIPTLVRHALRGDYAGLHIHDYYFLGAALFWKALRHKPVIYDVHEYYAEYYSARLPLASKLSKLYVPAIDLIQVLAAKALGGANVVTEEMATSFRRARVPLSVTPNYPLYSTFGPAVTAPTAARMKKVVHNGTLSDWYGMEVLVKLATRLKASGDYTLTVFQVFPNATEKQKFSDLCAAHDVSDFVNLVGPMPSHEVPQELAKHGIGLSLIQNKGQNDIAIPTKLYEYAMLGLAIVGSDLKGHRAFVNELGCGRLAQADDDAALFEAISEAAEATSADLANLERAQNVAHERFTWERYSSPRLERLICRLLGSE